MVAPSRRVFVALWPPDDVRARLAAVADLLAATVPGARRVPAQNLHMTLAFIGSLGEDRIASLVQRLASSPAAPVAIRVDRTGAFPRARVVWAGGESTVELAQLAQSVRELLQAMQIPFDTKPFAPHVTLLRDAPHRSPTTPGPVTPPIDWLCGPPLVIESRSGPHGPVYRPLHSV